MYLLHLNVGKGKCFKVIFLKVSFTCNFKQIKRYVASNYDWTKRATLLGGVVLSVRATIIIRHANLDPAWVEGEMWNFFGKSHFCIFQETRGEKIMRVQDTMIAKQHTDNCNMLVSQIHKHYIVVVVVENTATKWLLFYCTLFYRS